MIEYTFRHGPFFFRIHAENNEDAIRKAKRTIDETAPTSSITYLPVDLTTGAFDGRLYIDPDEINEGNICEKVCIPEVDVGVPF